jgi:bifunctional ADP-heptose synthase (sugar kinase/adenylyltransferase)
MSHYSLLEIRGSLVDTRVLILGDAMLDRFIYGNIGRNAGWAVA